MDQVPAPPNYTGAAVQQGQAAQANTAAQTAANRANTSTGFGSTNWSFSPQIDPQTGAPMKDANGNPLGSWQESSSLNGPLGQAQGLSEQQLVQGLGQPLDTGTSARDQAVNAMYGAEAQQLNPQWALNDEMTQSQLANEGLSPTSEAARAQMNQEGLAKNQAYSQALSNAQQLGNEAQGITFGENVQSRELPFQELQGLLGLEAQPNYNQAGVAQAPDLLGAAGLSGSDQLQRANMQYQLEGADTTGFMNFLGSMAKAAGGA